MTAILKFGAYVPETISMRPPYLAMGNSVENGYDAKIRTKSGKYILSVLFGKKELFGFYSNGIDTYEIALIDPSIEVRSLSDNNFVWEEQVRGYQTAEDILKVLEEN